MPIEKESKFKELEVGCGELENKFQSGISISIEDVLALKNILLSLQRINAKELALELKTIAFRFWNVAIKISQLSSPNNNLNQTSFESNLQIRLLAADCLAWVSVSNGDSDEEVVTKVVQFYSRIGKLFSERNNIQMAEQCFSNAMEYWERLNQKWPALTDVDKKSQSRLLFSLYCWRAEACWNNNQKDLTRNFIGRAKSLLVHIPDDSMFLVQMCYRLAEQSESSKNNLEVVEWLEQGFQLTHLASSEKQKPNQPLEEIQLQILRWLVEKYIEIHEFDKATTTLKLAIQQQSNENSFEAIQLLAKLNITAKRNEQASKYLKETIQHPECTLQIAISMCKLAIEKQLYEIAFQNGLKPLTSIQRFINKPEFGFVLICMVELVLNPNWFDEIRAKETIDQIFLAHINSIAKLSNEFWDDFCSLIWNTATRLFEMKRFEESLVWFEKASNGFANGNSGQPNEQQKQNFSKCQLMMSRCLFELSRFCEAHEKALKYSSPNSENSSTFHFVLFKIALAEKNIGEAHKELEKLAKSSDSNVGLLELCASEAFELKRTDIAIKAMEIIISTSQRLKLNSASVNLMTMDSESLKSELQHMIVVTRNLVRLQLQSEETKLGDKNEIIVDILAYLNQIVTTTKSIFEAKQSISNSINNDEWRWLMGISYNLACEITSQQKQTLSEKGFQNAVNLMLVANELACFITPEMIVGSNQNNEVISFRRKCLIFASQFILDSEENSTRIAQSNQNSMQIDSPPKVESMDLKNVLIHLEKVKQFDQQLSSATNASNQKSSSTSKQTSSSSISLESLDQKEKELICLLEFRAKALMRDPNLTLFLKSIQKNQQYSADFFLELAGVCRQTHPLVFVESIRIALTKLLSFPTVDYEKCAQLFRVLAEENIQKRNQEEFLGILDEVAKLTQGLGSEIYPTCELEWMMIECWNFGLGALRWIHLKDAEKFMSKAIQFLNKLPIEMQKQQYSSIPTKYEQLLQKMNQSQTNGKESQLNLNKQKSLVSELLA